MLRNIFTLLFAMTATLGQAQDGFFLDNGAVTTSSITDRITTSVRATRSDGGLIPPHYSYNKIETHNQCLQNIRHNLLTMINSSEWSEKLRQLRKVADSPSNSPSGFEIVVQGIEMTDHRGRTGLKLQTVNIFAHSHIDSMTSGRISAPISINMIANNCLWQNFEVTLKGQVDAAIYEKTPPMPKHHIGSPELPAGQRLQKALVGVPVIN